MHILLLVGLILASGAMLLGLLRPFLTSLGLETEQVADILSQLPPDVDVEGLVLRTVSGKAGEWAGGAKT